MNGLEIKFRDLLRDELDSLYKDAQISLTTPISVEVATDIHEIGVLRGYMKAMVQVYDLCDKITEKMLEPEKKNDAKPA